MTIYLILKRVIAAIVLFFLLSFTSAFGADNPIEKTEVDTVGYYYNETEHVLTEDQKNGKPLYSYGNIYSSRGRRGYQYYTSGRNYTKQYRVVGIERKDNETLVDFMIKPTGSPAWGSISENIYLRDKKTGDMYKIRRENNGIPLGRVLVITDWYNRYLCYTFVFPPLPSSVKVVDLFVERSKTRVLTDNMKIKKGGSWNDYNLNVKKYEKIRNSATKIIE